MITVSFRQSISDHLVHSVPVLDGSGSVLTRPDPAFLFGFVRFVVEIVVTVQSWAGTYFADPA